MAILHYSRNLAGDARVNAAMHGTRKFGGTYPVELYRTSCGRFVSHGQRTLYKDNVDCKICKRKEHL